MNIRKIMIVSLACIAGTSSVFGQQQRPNWQNMDLKTDSVFGISTEKAYQELLKGKTPKPVIVAVIDGGVDTLHEDLKSVLWVNPKPETGDNGTYGWNYIGSAKGNVHYDNLELTRQVRQQQGKFEGKDSTAFRGSDLGDGYAYAEGLSELSAARAR
jgi:hypothetical protein